MILKEEVEKHTVEILCQRMDGFADFICIAEHCKRIAGDCNVVRENFEFVPGIISFEEADSSAAERFGRVADGVYLIAPVGEARDTFSADELIEAIKYIGKGKIVYLKSKPEILLFTTAHMLQIEPRFTYATIGTFNTKTAEEKLYYYVADINLFTEEEKESEDWIVESAQDIDSCKKIINENLDTTKISQLIDEINKIQTNYYNNVINPEFKDKIFHLAINHQLLESVCALQRVLMYAGLPYEFPKETEENKNV